MHHVIAAVVFTSSTRQSCLHHITQQLLGTLHNSCSDCLHFRVTRNTCYCNGWLSSNNETVVCWCSTKQLCVGVPSHFHGSHFNTHVIATVGRVTTKQCWSTQRNSVGRHNETVLVDTTKQCWSTQRNSVGRHNETVLVE
jgi:hypothetical protein